MKVSDVSLDDIKRWGRIEIEDDDLDIGTLIMPAAKARLLEYTGLSEDALDKSESLTMGYIALCVFLYDNRTMNIVNDKQNDVVRSFLDAHRVNLL